MSHYTTEIRFLVESGWDFGLKSYPIFQESYRAGLNTKIIEHYYFREIGQETAELFTRMLNREMNEQMPYFNQLYNSALIKIEPLLRLEWTVTNNREITDFINRVSNSSNDTQGTNKDIFSDTPQGLLNLPDIENNLYATTANLNNGTQNQQINSTDNNTRKGTDDYTKLYKGNNGTRTDAEMLLEYRSTFLNIDMDVISSLGDLFLNLY